MDNARWPVVARSSLAFVGPARPFRASIQAFSLWIPVCTAIRKIESLESGIQNWLAFEKPKALFKIPVGQLSNRTTTCVTIRLANTIRHNSIDQHNRKGSRASLIFPVPSWFLLDALNERSFLRVRCCLVCQRLRWPCRKQKDWREEPKKP